MEKVRCGCGTDVWVVPLDVGCAGKCPSCGWVFLGGTLRPTETLILPPALRPGKRIPK